MSKQSLILYRNLAIKVEGTSIANSVEKKNTDFDSSLK